MKTASNHVQLRKFAIVGSIGFLVDGGLLSLLTTVFSWEISRSRIVSFFSAVSATWWLNRNNTFALNKDSRPGREWARYIFVNSIGVAINMGVFFWLVDQHEVFYKYPIIALIVASAIAFGFNYSAAKHFAFKVVRK